MMGAEVVALVKRIGLSASCTGKDQRTGFSINSDLLVCAPCQVSLRAWSYQKHHQRVTENCSVTWRVF